MKSSQNCLGREICRISKAQTSQDPPVIAGAEGIIRHPNRRDTGEKRQQQSRAQDRLDSPEMATVQDACLWGLKYFRQFA